MAQATERFTTYEAIRFIELSMNKRHRTVQSFINAICNTKTDKQDSGLIKDNKELCRAKGLKNKLDATLKKLDHEEFIQNVHKNLRSEKAIGYLDLELRNRIKLAENIESTSEHVNNPDIITKKELLGIKEYPWLLIHVLYCTLINQSADREIYHSLYGKDSNGYTLEPDSQYYSALEEKLTTIESDSKALFILENPKKDFIFLHSLEILSDSIYKDILQKEKRYHATSIESMLLTLGSDKALPTYGSSKDILNEMSYYFGLEDNLFIVGEGGIGKTTLLINALNEYYDKTKSLGHLDIPIFITLNRLKNNNMAPSGSYIISEIILKIKDLIRKNELKLNFNAYDIESMIEQAFDLESSSQKIVLLLDGYNEISNISGSVTRDKIKKEIEELARNKNVRIILTSRPFYDQDNSFTSFNHVYAKGIDDATLNRYLIHNNISLSHDDVVYDLLHNPLFLCMYKVNAEKGITDANTRGAILYEFCNGNSSSYNELNRITDPTFTGEPLPNYTPLLFDFIMPAIAATMEMNDVFYISNSDLRRIIKQTEALTEPFDISLDKYFKVKYGSRDSISSLADDLTATGSSITKVLVDELSFLQQDSDGNMFFVHQYIKDYFASLFRIFTYRQKFVSRDNLYDKYAHTLMDTDTFLLTKQVADQSGLCDLSLLKSVLSSCPDKHNTYFINNLFKMLSVFNNNTLCGLTLDGFDFSSVHMMDYSFSDGLNPAKFINCTFTDNSFLDYSNAQSVLRTITLYDNKPAMCEVIIIHDITALIRIKDLKSSSILFTDSFSHLTTDVFLDFDDINAIDISNDGKYIIMYATDPSKGFFYAYNLKNHRFYLHLCAMTDAQYVKYVFMHDDRLLIIYDSRYVYIYNLSYLHEIPENDFDLKAYHADKEYKGIISSFILPLDNLLSHMGDIPSFNLHEVYIHGDYLLLLFNTPDIRLSLCVYSLTDHKLIPIDIPKIMNEMPSFKMLSYKDDQHLYFTFGDSIFEFDISSLIVKLIFTMPDHNNFIALSHNEDIIYVITFSGAYDISVSNSCILNSYSIASHSYADSFISNNNCIVYGSTIMEECWAGIYRFDTHEITHYDYSHPTAIMRSVPLSNDLIMLIYTSGYVAVLRADDMKLIDSFTLPHNQVFIDIDYNEDIEQIALLTYDPGGSAPFDRPAEVYIFDVSYEDDFYLKQREHKTHCYMEGCVCFSFDGSFLFHGDMGTIKVYTTYDYELYKTIEIGAKIECIRSYEGYVVAIINRGDTDYEVMILNVSDDICENEQFILPKEDNWPYKTCANEIAPYIYETTCYYNESHMSWNMIPLNKQFFYCYDTPKPYYFQDDILIKCTNKRVESRNIYNFPEMTTHCAILKKNLNAYYALNHNGEFIKRDLSSKLGQRLYCIPDLLINKCHFSFKKKPTEYIQNIITDNLGIVD